MTSDHCYGDTMTLKNFIASEDERESVSREFERYSFALDFSDTEADYLCQIPAVMGVYFIAGSRDGKMLNAYVGKTTNVHRRFRDYHRGFQVHCPNDRKIAFLQDWLRVADPGWKLHLHTLLVDKKEALSRTERLWIKKLDPLVNGTVKSDETHGKAVQKACRDYFCGYFARRAQAGG